MTTLHTLLFAPDGLASTVGAVGYLLVLLVIFPFGAHRLYLVWLRLRADGGGAPDDAVPVQGGDLPTVTVQLPVYNEAAVVGRAVDAACRLDYPRDRLEVQILDDSTDGTSRIAARRAARWRRRGVDVHHLPRETREGFKAGALAAGVDRARGEYFLVLDADFVPPRDLPRRLLPSFRAPEVGFVQAAWDHLNGEEDWLTRGQALLLDAHFAVEHEARFRNGLFFNFNGTAGMWRRECLEEVGGWSGETLTEDLELSYRAQLGGWRGVYRDDVRVPGEVPPTLRALEVQQERWTRGGLQTARRILPRMWRADVPLAVKMEAASHLLGHVMHPVTVLLGVALAWPGRLGGAAALVPDWVHLVAVCLAVVPFLAYYGLAARLRGRGPAASVARTFDAVTLGIGLGPPLARAAWRGLVEDRSGTFRRTPKTGDGPSGGWPAGAYALPFRPGRTSVRVALGLLLVLAVIRLAVAGEWAGAMFTGLFGAGYLRTALAGLAGSAGRPPGEGAGASAPDGGADALPRAG